jgi:APA family basic amino acid/polyamine antiporter
MTPMPAHADSGLIRSIRKWDLIAVTVNSVIGAGIFGLPSKIYGLVGNYSLFAFLLCAVFAAMIVLCFAEVASRYSDTGGPYLYARDAFGPVAGFTIGWLMWIARTAAFAANTAIMLGYLSVFWPAVASGPVRSAVICLLTLALATVNLIGVRDVALTTNILTIAKLTPLALLIVGGFFFLDPSRFALGPAPQPIAFSGAMLLLVYAYTGFEIAVVPAAEMRDPRRHLPFAILTTIGIVALLYVLIQVVCIGTLPGLATSDRPLADAASRIFGRYGAAMISAGAALSILANLNVVVLSASRIPFAMAARDELPSVLARINNRFHTPHMSIILTCGLMGALTLSGGLLYSVTISTIARLVIYAATCSALPVLRRRANAAPASFRAPGGVPIALIVVALASWLLWNATFRELRDTAIAVAVGLAAYTLSRLSASLSR